MRYDAVKQNMILKILLQNDQPTSLRKLTNMCDLTYHQVASCLSALCNKGYVQRVKAGVYQVTDEGRLLEVSLEEQVKALKMRVASLEKLSLKLIEDASNVTVSFIRRVFNIKE